MAVCAIFKSFDSCVENLMNQLGGEKTGRGGRETGEGYQL